MSWQVIKGLKEQRAKAFADAAAIREVANKENRDLNEDENNKHNALMGDVDTLGKRIEREERSAGAAETMIDKIVADKIEKRENSVGMPAKDFRRYSLFRAITRTLNREPLDGVEAEVSKELEKRSGKAPKSFYMPIDLPMNNRTTINDTVNEAGAIATTLAPTFIDVLRNALVVRQAGATVLTDMQGNFAIPKKSQTTSAYWVAEGVAPTSGFLTIGQVPFTPHTVGTYTDLTRRLIEQMSFDAEEMVKQDLAAGIAREIDRAALFGSGSNGQPNGVVTQLLAQTNTPQILPSGTNGAAPTFATVVEMEEVVALANAEVPDKMSYITNAKVRAALKLTAKSSSAVAAGFVWDNNEVNGHPAWMTNMLPYNGTKGSGTNLSTMVYGNFSDLVLAFWSGLDILVDPYSQSSTGNIRIVALQDLDTNVRRLESFCAVTDIVAA